MSESTNQAIPEQAAAVRLLLAFVVPLATAVLFSVAAANLWGTGGSERALSAVLLAGAGLSSWLIGLRWYGVPGMGLRGGRPLTAGLGFASLFWVIMVVLRFIFVEISPAALAGRPPGAGQTFFYLLLFEALAAQIWTFGLIFRATSDWRGPLTAAVVSGIAFGSLAILLFEESVSNSLLGAFYFLAWGILYGIIRLRTGSWLGPAIVQAAQSFSMWVILAPPSPINVGQLNNLYVAGVIVCMILGWRLWPKNKSDYRV